MHILDPVQSIRPVWINRVAQQLAKGTGVRENFRDQLARFFDLMAQVLETGQPDWLDSILADWSKSLPGTDHAENDQSLTLVLGEIMEITHSVCFEVLEPEHAQNMFHEMLPCFNYAFRRAAFYETEVRVNYMNTELNRVRQTLERLDRSKSDFIAVAAHELKTPLTLVEGYSAMLREIKGAQIDGTEEVLLGGIATGTRRLRTIIDDMIDVSLIDNSLLSLNFQPVWLNRILNVLKTEVKDHVEDRRQTFEIREFTGASEMTFGDPERLLQVFRNVILNAIKYTPDEGVILVDGRKLPGFVEVTISDTGIGIANEDTQVIFEKFGRLGNTALHSSGKTKFKGGGPGLGLHIAKGIVEAHGGAIWVESPGYDEIRCPGSCFHILLPLRNEPPDDKMAKLFAPLIHGAKNEE